MEEVGVEALQLQPKRGKGLFWRSILRTMKRTASQSFPEPQQPTIHSCCQLGSLCGARPTVLLWKTRWTTCFWHSKQRPELRQLVPSSARQDGHPAGPRNSTIWSSQWPYQSRGRSPRTIDICITQPDVGREVFGPSYYLWPCMTAKTRMKLPSFRTKG